MSFWATHTLTSNARLLVWRHDTHSDRVSVKVCHKLWHLDGQVPQLVFGRILTWRQGKGSWNGLGIENCPKAIGITQKLSRKSSQLFVTRRLWHPKVRSTAAMWTNHDDQSKFIDSVTSVYIRNVAPLFRVNLTRCNICWIVSSHGRRFSGCCSRISQRN